MNLNLNLNVQQRIEATKQWELLFNQKRTAKDLALERDILLRQLFPLPFEQELNDATIDSSLMHDGFFVQDGLLSPEESSQFVSLLEQDYPCKLDDNYVLSGPLLDLFDKTSLIERVLRSLYEQTGVHHLVWHCIPVFKMATTRQPSDAWHYDNHYTQWHPKLMIYLNDQAVSKGATEFCCSSISSAFTALTNYIGVLWQRPLYQSYAEKACPYLPLDSLNDPSYTRFSPHVPGSAAWFYPSRVLHRGVAPSSGKRHVLSFSFLPVPPSSGLTIESCIEHSKAILRNAVAQASHLASLDQRIQFLGVDAIPLFTSSDSALSENLSQAFLRPIAVDTDGISPAYGRCILKAIFPDSFQAKPSFDVLVESVICSLDPSSSINIQQFLQQVADVILSCSGTSEEASSELMSHLQAYASSYNVEMGRYSLPKERIFWPDPTHPQYPRFIATTDLATRRIPLFTPQTVIGSAGSCFAFEIAESLQLRNYTYSYFEETDKQERGLVLLPQQDEARQRLNNPKIVNFSCDYGIIFNSLSLYQLAERAFGSSSSLDRILAREGNFYIDPFRENVLFPSEDAYQAEYPLHTQALASAFVETEVFLFTLGLNECWRHRLSGRAISRNPRHNSLLPVLRHHVLSLQENIDAIQGFFDIVKSHNPSFRLVLTVSPIAFLATGRGATHHVVEANHHSKSVLTVAANELAAANPDIHYFPSYEQTMYVMDDPWLEDGRHLKRSAVEQNVDLFIRMYSAE